MSLSYLDKTGLAALWAKIKALVPKKVTDLEDVAEPSSSYPNDGAVLVWKEYMPKQGWYYSDAHYIAYENAHSDLNSDTVGGAIDELDSEKNPLITNYSNTSQGSISLSSGTTSSAFTDVTDVILQPGIWLVFGTLNFATNSSGTRAGLISATSNASVANYWGTVIAGAADGMNTRIQVISIVKPVSNTTYYLEAKQTSGSTLTTTGQINYLKLS